MWKKKGQQTIPERPEEEEEASLDKPSRRNITCGNKIDKVLESHQSQRRYKDEFSLNLFSLSKDKAKKKLLGKDYMNLNVMSNKEKFSKTTSFPFIHINNDGDNDRNFREIKLTCEEREDLKTTKFNTKQNEINTVETFENLELTQYASTNTEKMRLYIKYKEAYNFFLSLNTSDKRNKISVEDLSHLNCCHRMFFSCTKKFVLYSELHDERLFVFATAKIKYDENEETHTRIMTTIYKTFTCENECQLQGDHWLKIGFQSNQPSNDLRSVGMFGALQMLAYVDRYQTLARSVYSLSISMDGHFPLASLLLNFTQICLQNLKQGYLIPICNKTNSVLNTLNCLYFGMIEHFVSCLNRSTTLEQMPDMLQKINKLMKDDAKFFIKIEENLSRRFPQMKDSMSLGESRE